MPDFEGEIKLRAQGKFATSDGPLDLTLLVKDRRVRVDLPEALVKARGLGQTHLLALPAEKKLYAVLEARKQAVLIDLDKVAQQATTLGLRRGPKMEPGMAPRLVKTGKLDAVAGKACEIWHYEQEKSVGELCLAEQETSWFNSPLVGLPGDLAWATQITDGKHLPLRFVAGEQGIERGRIEVTSIVEMPLKADAFEIPSNYAVIGLEELLGGMMAGLGSLGGSGVNLPPGIKLPAGVKASPGIKLPPSVTLPPNAPSK